MPSIRALFRPALLRPILGAAALAMAAVPAIAHHGWSTYDETKPMTLTGKIVESHYENPHAHIRIDAGGKRWLAVLAPVSRMEARGATSDKIAVGREIALVGYASKEKPDELRAERITVDGKTVELR